MKFNTGEIKLFSPTSHQLFLIQLVFIHVIIDIGYPDCIFWLHIPRRELGYL